MDFSSLGIVCDFHFGNDGCFAVALALIGITFLPVNGWIKAYMGMGTIFSVASTFSVAKTTRDMHEAKRLISRVDDAKLERMLAEHDPFNK